MNKKTKAPEAVDSEEKSLFRQAGEVIGSIGAHIVLAKESVVDFVSAEAESAKKTVKTITGKSGKKGGEKAGTS